MLRQENLIINKLYNKELESEEVIIFLQQDYELHLNKTQAIITRRTSLLKLELIGVGLIFESERFVVIGILGCILVLFFSHRVS